KSNNYSFLSSNSLAKAKINIYLHRAYYIIVISQKAKRYLKSDYIYGAL
ncbi:unnamed protein product, partial [marine sediment metagenome]